MYCSFGNVIYNYLHISVGKCAQRHHGHLRWSGWSFEYIHYLYGITNIQSTKIDGLILNPYL